MLCHQKRSGNRVTEIPRSGGTIWENDSTAMKKEQMFINLTTGYQLPNEMFDQGRENPMKANHGFTKKSLEKFKIVTHLGTLFLFALPV